MSNNSISSGLFVNFALSMLLKKIVVPSGYQDQCKAIKEMLVDDFTGLIDSLTDFSVESANVDFTIRTGSEKFTEKLQYWFDNVNGGYDGLIPRGINALAKEYFKERWKASSFPILKILEWRRWKGIVVPSKMCIVDGGSVYSKEKTGPQMQKQLLGYSYYVGDPNDKDSEELKKGVIITKPFGRWFDEYPTPFLIKRGIYHNYQIIKSLKEKQTTILDQILPYLLFIKKGSEGLATSDNSPKRSYSQPELDKIVKQFQDMMDELKSTTAGEKAIKAPIRATQFDEEIKHLIPDMGVIFKKELFEVTEKAILCGIGFIDVIEATSTSRRESILNPKVFIQDVKVGVKDFKEQILTELVRKIVEKNKAHRKYANSKVDIISSPVTAFMTDKFKELIRQMYDRGRISSQTAIELIGEIPFEIEVNRREQETKDKIEEKMYPVVTRNQEDKGMDNPKGETPEVDENGNAIPDDKVDPGQKEEYNISSEEMEVIKDLVGAPYPTIKSLPESVKKLAIGKQRKWRKVWNSAYKYALGKFKGDKKKAETYAFKVAWASIK